MELHPRLPSDLKAIGQKFFSGDEPAFATTLVYILVKAYGFECLNWDGVTIQMQVKDDFGVEMPRRIYDKLMGLITALTTDVVYKDVAVFDEIISALTGKGIGVEQDAPAVEDVAWTVAEIQLNDPDPVSRNPQDPWKKDIKRYVRVVLDNEGFSIPPKILEFAPAKPIQKEGMDDNAYYAGAWGSQQEKADEVDLWVNERIGMLIDQLAVLGFPATID